MSSETFRHVASLAASPIQIPTLFTEVMFPVPVDEVPEADTSRCDQNICMKVNIYGLRIAPVLPSYSLTTADLLMRFREIIAVYSENYTT
jgi:hypothetical protein